MCLCENGWFCRRYRAELANKFMNLVHTLTNVIDCPILAFILKTNDKCFADLDTLIFIRFNSRAKSVSDPAFKDLADLIAYDPLFSSSVRSLVVANCLP